MNPLPRSRPPNGKEETLMRVGEGEEGMLNLRFDVLSYIAGLCGAG